MLKFIGVGSRFGRILNFFLDPDLLKVVAGSGHGINHSRFTILILGILIQQILSDLDPNLVVLKNIKTRVGLAEDISTCKTNKKILAKLLWKIFYCTDNWQQQKIRGKAHGSSQSFGK